MHEITLASVLIHVDNWKGKIIGKPQQNVQRKYLFNGLREASH